MYLRLPGGQLELPNLEPVQTPSVPLLFIEEVAFCIQPPFSYLLSSFLKELTALLTSVAKLAAFIPDVILLVIFSTGTASVENPGVPLLFKILFLICFLVNSPTSSENFKTLLDALFTVLALRAVGSLLMGALLVIPALSARLLANSPKQMVIWAFVLAQLGVSVGLWSSAALNISTGLSIVLCMALSFAVIFITQKLKNQTQAA